MKAILHRRFLYSKQTANKEKSYTKVLDFATGRWGMTIVGLRRPDQVSEITMESPGLCGSYLTEAGSPSRQE